MPCPQLVVLLAAATVRARVCSRAASWFPLVGALVTLMSVPLANLPFEATLAWLGLVLLKTRNYASGRRRSKSRR